MCITESFCRKTEISATLSINYISIRKLKFKKLAFHHIRMNGEIMLIIKNLNILY